MIQHRCIAPVCDSATSRSAALHAGVRRWLPNRWMLTAQAKEKLTPEFLRDHVGAEIKSFGTLEEVGRPLTEKSGPSDIVSFPVRFSSVRLSVQI